MGLCAQALKAICTTGRGALVRHRHRLPSREHRSSSADGASGNRTNALDLGGTLLGAGSAACILSEGEGRVVPVGRATLDNVGDMKRRGLSYRYTSPSR